MKKGIIRIIFFNILLTIAGSKTFAQDNSAALAAADTTNFSVNGINGWQLFNSYVANYGADSVHLEIIVQHANNLNWGQEQYVGKIKPVALIPAQDQIVSFSLLTNQYRLRIDPEGKCYLRLFTGAAPPDDPAVIPVNATYKK
jgi:hypothetical protein